MRELLEDVYKKAISFLNKEQYKYLVIGGIAAGILGEPRMTGDIDIDIVLDKNDIVAFLNKVHNIGFIFDRDRCIKMAYETGTFKIFYDNFHIDFIISSTELEKEAFNRSKKISIYGILSYFPTPEDLILFKIIPGRSQDLLDIEKIIIRNKSKLDVPYIMNWAQRLSEEAEDMRFYNQLKKYLL